MGSITQISDENGNLADEYSYDAWGRRRDKDTWQTYSPGTEPSLLFGRGYTGHEHLSQFGLINMNARLYDPVLGRFLAPDPQVASPETSNGYNRYMYARNNPMMFVDLDGEQEKSKSNPSGNINNSGPVGTPFTTPTSTTYSPGTNNLGGPNGNGPNGNGLIGNGINGYNYQGGGYSGGSVDFGNYGYGSQNGVGGFIVVGLQWIFGSHGSKIDPRFAPQKAGIVDSRYAYSNSAKAKPAKAGASTVYSGGQKRGGSPAYKVVDSGSDVGQRITRLKQFYQDFDPSISIKTTVDVFMSNSLSIEDYVLINRYKGKTDAELIMNKKGFIEEVRWGKVTISENTQTTSLGPISYGFREDFDNSFNIASILEYSRETNNGLTVGRTFYLKKSNINLRLSAPKYRTIYPVPFYMRLLPALF